jgi:hypothetical protein
LLEFQLTKIPKPLIWTISHLMGAFFSTLIFLLVGLALIVLRPFDKQALLLALWFGAANNWNLAADVPPLLTGLYVATYLVSILAFPTLLHFFLVFPERSKLLTRFPRLEYYLYLPWLLPAIPLALLRSWVYVTAPERFEHFAEDYPFYDYLSWLSLAYIIVMLGAMVVNYRRTNQMARRKLRVIVFGTLVGLVPVGLFWAIVRFIKLPDTWWHQANIVSNLLIILVPLSFAYAILRHKVIPVSLIIRRSVQYLFARNALRLLLALPVVGLVLTIILNPNRTLTEILFRNSFYFYLLLLAAIATTLVFRKRLTAWIDRKFFREVYNQEKILHALIDDVKKLDSISEMSKRVSEQLERAIHPTRTYLFYREEERRDLSLSYTSGGTSHELRIPEEFRLLRFMEDYGSAQDFPFPQKNNLPQSEKEWLAQLETRLIVPMTGTDGRLAGLFLLGDKKSEVPYTATDRQLLEALADQIAIVYENVRLRERVERDRKIKHEVLARFEGRDINLLKECPKCGACFDSTVQICDQDGSELTLTLPVERTIEKRYRLDHLIGKGGMGAVYRATDERLNREVALKILSGQMFGNREALRRFEREAQTSARLSHPNIITVYDYGQLTTEGAYLVMELAEGETLGGALKRDGPLAPEIAARYFEQVLAAVGVAHEANVIHRDLKPDNLFLARGEKGQAVVKVLDFGLAKIMLPNFKDAGNPDHSPTMTTPGAVMGTFGYMSPEQLTGGTVDNRSDLFSIGVIVVEALTGRRPFNGKTYHELLNSILNQPFQLEGDVAEVVALDEVLQKCLAKDARDRFSSAAEMQSKLIPAIGLCPSLATDLREGPDAATAILGHRRLESDL